MTDSDTGASPDPARNSDSGSQPSRRRRRRRKLTESPADQQARNTDRPENARGRSPRSRRRRREEPEPELDEINQIERDPDEIDEPEPAVYQVEMPEDGVDPDALKVLRRLSQHGYQAYLVGGGVRDLLLGKSPKDFDVATSARPQDVRRLFGNCRVIGRRFRLAHVMFAGGKIIEVATFRRDPTQELDRLEPELARRWPLVSDFDPVRIAPKTTADDVRPDDDLLIVNDNVFGEPFEDAVRRDFTINGLFYDAESGEVIDYVGGMADLERRRLRMIGDPIVRFREDPIRILRAIKFSARLDVGISEEVHDAIVTHREELDRAARPRIFEEVLRFLRGGEAHRSFYLAWDLGVLAQILPELASYLDDGADEGDATWRRLAAIDRRLADGEELTDAVMMAALLWGPIREALEGARNQMAAYDGLMGDLALRIAMPRRLKDRVRLVTGSQRRLRAGKLGAIEQRDFFAEAATLHAIDCEARGLEIPEWAIDPPYIEPERPAKKRRRRGGRRRRS